MVQPHLASATAPDAKHLTLSPRLILPRPIAHPSRHRHLSCIGAYPAPTRPGPVRQGPPDSFPSDEFQPNRPIVISQEDHWPQRPALRDKSTTPLSSSQTTPPSPTAATTFRCPVASRRKEASAGGPQTLTTSRTERLVVQHPRRPLLPGTPRVRSPRRDVRGSKGELANDVTGHEHFLLRNNLLGIHAKEMLACWKSELRTG